MPGDRSSFSGSGVSDSDAAIVAADTPSREPGRGIVIPDFLRPLTVGWFAPYRLYSFNLTAGSTQVVLPANPMRVGLLFGVTNLVGVNLAVSAGPSGCPDGYVALTIANNETRSAMLADLFSLVLAEWWVRVPADCTVSVAEYVRPA